MSKRSAVRYDENGLPRDARDWTEADWRTLWDHMRAVIAEIGARHRAVNGCDRPGSPDGRGTPPAAWRVS